MPRKSLRKISVDADETLVNEQVTVMEMQIQETIKQLQVSETEFQIKHDQVCQEVNEYNQRAIQLNQVIQELSVWEREYLDLAKWCQRQDRDMKQRQSEIRKARKALYLEERRQIEKALDVSRLLSLP